ncbi:hypothetical protein [Haloferula sp. BvORR071]|uniref:hypothetical protein n=1 Tax=Haloferula sp. BvORR071 TaxID=1396141 RepID=UPI00069852FD|nr:hypothetical protein [Haloferula sp. BvORR071]
MKKFALLPIAALVSTATLHAQQVPKCFEGLLKPGVPVKAEVVVPTPPPELNKYVAKVEAAARKNPDWFIEYSKTGKKGVPLPYDERLGLTKEEYDEYLKLWAKRELRPTEGVTLLLRSEPEGRWALGSSGSVLPTLVTLKYDSKEDAFSSPNGTLKRIDDVAADVNSTLGAWTGAEWRYLAETTLASTKENVAVGKTGDGKYGLLIYSFQEISAQGSPLGERKFVIRFPLGAAGIIEPKPAATPAPAPGTKPTPAPAPKPTTKPKKK